MVRVFAVLAALPAVAALALSGQCDFESAPAESYFWDPACGKVESLGCMADGKTQECRFCGGEGNYKEVFCPASWCEFDEPQHTPYFWDSRCHSDGVVGCLADGKHLECRFCGEYPYNGTVYCPDNKHVKAPSEACNFDGPAPVPYFWDVTCQEGDLGCKADGKHLGCRFCGGGDYVEVACPGSLCTFLPSLQPPAHTYFWDPECWVNETSLGCLADGIHPQCRYCGAPDYPSIPCPDYSDLSRRRSSLIRDA